MSTDTTTEQEAPPAYRIQIWMVQVIRTTQITPHVQRIAFGGEGLVDFPEGREGAHMRVLFPLEGQTEPVLPTITAEGIKWPPKEIRPPMRVYTLRNYNAEANEIELDFVLHGDNGPASTWANHAKPGDTVAVGGLAEPEAAAFTADWCLFAGDLTSLPAIGAYLERLPASTRGEAFIEVPDLAEVQQLNIKAQVTVNWIPQKGVRPGRSTLLLDAVRQVAWPQQGTPYVWLAGESSAVVAVRNFLRAEYGLTRKQMYAVPYWKAGLDEDEYHEERHQILDDDDDGNI